MTFWFCNPCRGKMADSHEKPGGCSCASRPSRAYHWLHDSSNWDGKEIIRWEVTKVYLYLHSNIYVSGPIFVKAANEFYLNIYHLVVYLRLSVEFFFRNLKGLPWSWLTVGNICFVFHVVFTFIFKFLFIFLTDKGYT